MDEPEVKREWEKAGQSFRKAIAISPSNTLCRHLYAFYLSLVGDPEESVKHMEIAHGLDPLSLMTNSALADTYFWARR